MPSESESSESEKQISEVEEEEEESEYEEIEVEVEVEVEEDEDEEEVEDENKEEPEEIGDDNGEEEEEEEEEQIEEVEVEEEVEEEEEEVEEEEVEEVEEEIEEEDPEEGESSEEEEEVVEEEKGDDSTLASPKNDDDSSQEVELEGHDEDLILEKSKESLAEDVPDTSSGKFDSVDQSDEPIDTEVKEISPVSDGDCKPQVLNKDIISSEDNNSQNSPSKKAIGPQPKKRVEPEACMDVEQGSGKIHCGIASAVEEPKSLYSEEKEEAIILKASSSITPQIRPRSSSPDAEIVDGNKRPAIVCAFFARGWCIKGNSCKFVHQKDGSNSSSKCSKQDALPASSKDKLEEVEGWTVENRTSSFSCELLSSSNVNNPSLKSSLPLERIQVGEYGEGQRSNQFLDKYGTHTSPGAHGDPKFGSPGNGWSSKAAASGSQWKSSMSDGNIRSSGMPLLPDNLNHRPDFMRQRRPESEEFVRDYSSSMNNLVPEHKFNSIGSHTPSSVYDNINSFSYDKYGSQSSGSLGFFSSLNSGSNNSLPAKGISPSRQTFPWSGTAPSQLASLDGDQSYYSSRSSVPLRHSSSPFHSRPNLGNMSHRSVHGDPLNNWEPSKPFRPSFDYSVISSSPRSQYDPLLDSIDLPNERGRSFQGPFLSEGPIQGSFLSEGATMRSIPNQQANGDTFSFHQQPQYGTLAKNLSIQDIGASATPAEASRSLVTERQNKNHALKEEKALKRGPTVHTSNAMELDHDRGLGHADLNKHNKESKVLKAFRTALVDFVKELVKPHWRDGLLSKDAHNTVVKKAVEKVLSALQPHQIPATIESTNHYLSSSQPKLAKLVEGYVGKYAKGSVAE